MDPILDAHTIAAIQRQRQMGLGWRWDGLGNWTTGAIFAKLRELGIDTDSERFADQAKQARNCSTLRESWKQGNERFDLWDDFPLLATEELWHRKCCKRQVRNALPVRASSLAPEQATTNFKRSSH